MKVRNKTTGEIKEAKVLGVIGMYQAGKVWSSGEYSTLEELYNDWETYIPKEPLIKDEEVRNIVRLWAKYHNADILRYLQKRDIDGQYLKGHYLKAGLNTIDIDVENLNVGMFYTIAELCGDEELCES